MSISSDSKAEIPYATLVGQVIRHLRTEHGLTQSDMASQLSMSVSGYSRIELGETQISAWQMRQCASLLGIDLTQLAARVDELEASVLKTGGVLVESKRQSSATAVILGAALLALLFSR